MKGITFVDSHKPALVEGTYTVTARLEVTSPAPKDTRFDSHLTFRVGGPLTPLHPAQVQSVFPPEGSLGPHTTALPQVVLDAVTLPFARSAKSIQDKPWLALLLVTEAELGGPVQPLPAAAKGAPERVRLPTDLLRRIAPRAADLPLLTHVRQLDNGIGRAVLLCPRLPREKTRNWCLLVSLLDLYEDGDWIVPSQPSTAEVTVLKRWSFSCVDDAESFARRKQRLEADAGPLRRPDPDPLPQPDPAQPYRAGGWSLLPYYRRDGGETFGLYRGPLAGGRPGTASGRPAPSAQIAADGLLEFHESLGLFDISYAAAWELGRMLALASTDMAQALVAARRRDRRQAVSAARTGGVPLLAGLSTQAAAPVPDALTAFLSRLERLEGVPFSYLIPAVSLLPPESLRGFSVDAHWIACLRAGALSPGRAQGDRFDRLRGPVALPVCGVIVRSTLIADFPQLEVEGFATRPVAGRTPPPPVAPCRLDRLSPTVLLALFDQVVVQVDIHPHEEVLHHGLAEDASGALSVALRHGDGRSAGTLALTGVAKYWHSEGKGVLNIAAIHEKCAGMLGLDANSSAAFALQTVQGTPRASFAIKLPSI